MVKFFSYVFRVFMMTINKMIKTVTDASGSVCELRSMTLAVALLFSILGAPAGWWG